MENAESSNSPPRQAITEEGIDDSVYFRKRIKELELVNITEYSI